MTVDEVNTQKIFRCLPGPGPRQSSGLRGLEGCEWGGCAARLSPKMFREREAPDPYLWRSSCTARSLSPKELLAPFSGSIFSFLESTDVPYPGPLPSAPTQDLGTRGFRQLEPSPRLADKKCPLYLPSLKPHTPRAGRSTSGWHLTERFIGARKNGSARGLGTAMLWS